MNTEKAFLFLCYIKMYFKRESERQDQEPHCKPKASEEQNLN